MGAREASLPELAHVLTRERVHREGLPTGGRLQARRAGQAEGSDEEQNPQRLTGHNRYSGRNPRRTTGAAMAVNKRPNLLWISFEDTNPTYGCYGDRVG